MGGRLLEGPTMVGRTSDWKEELRRFLKPFLDRLGHKARRQMCPLYVSGLIGPGDRKSIQPMAERLAFGEYDQLHHFIVAGVWDSKVPPRGNAGKPPTAGNTGTAVATPTFWLVPGIVWQQWMCAMVVIELKSLNVALICSVCATGSNTTVARPVASAALGGVSFAPKRFASKVIESAWTAGAGRVSAAVNVSKQEPIERRGNERFMFASPEKPAPGLDAAEASLGSN